MIPGIQRAQALVEFALVAPLLLLLLFGSVDLGGAYVIRLQVANAARVGARWASLHSGDVNYGWTPSATPAENTIEGQVIYAGDTLTVVNDDSHLAIDYYIWDQGTTNTVYCGRYSAAANSFVAATDAAGSPYTASQCAAVDNIVKVTVTYDYQPFTSILADFSGPSFPVVSSAAFVIQS